MFFFIRKNKNNESLILRNLNDITADAMHEHSLTHYEQQKSPALMRIIRDLDRNGKYHSSMINLTYETNELGATASELLQLGYNRDNRKPSSMHILSSGRRHTRLQYALFITSSQDEMTVITNSSYYIGDKVLPEFKDDIVAYKLSNVRHKIEEIKDNATEVIGRNPTGLFGRFLDYVGNLVNRQRDFSIEEVDMNTEAVVRYYL